MLQLLYLRTCTSLVTLLRPIDTESCPCLVQFIGSLLFLKNPIKTILFIFSIKDLPVSGPVGSWLSELKNVHESECTIMLQSKPVRRSDCDSVKEGVTEIKEKIRQSGH